MAIGASVAPRVHADRVWAALLAFFLAVGIGAHAFDELYDRPLGTRLSNRALAGMGGASLAVAIGIGIIGTITVSVSLAPLVAFGAFICVAYNLELLEGRFHNDAWFAMAWGMFPAFTGYWANALSFSVAGVLVALSCGVLSVAQRRLSTPARLLRRKTLAVSGEQRLRDGSSVTLTGSVLLAPLDAALKALSVAVTLLGVGLLAARL